MDWRRELELLQEKGENATFQDKLTAYKAVREAGVVPPDLSFFSIAYLLMNVAIDRMMSDQTLAGISDRLREIERKGDSDSKTTKETEVLMRGWELISEDMMEGFFKEHGEEEMAQLYLADRAEFDRRYENGRRMIFGPSESDKADT